MTIHDRINELVELHGSLRAVARVTEIDAGYLSRLRAGEKANPDKDKLRRLGLRRVVTFERLKQPNTADEPACAGRRNTMTTETIAGAGPVDQQEHFDRAFPEQPAVQGERVALTRDRIFEIAEEFGEFQYGDAQGDKRIGFARAIEAAHGIKGAQQ